MRQYLRCMGWTGDKTPTCPAGCDPCGETYYKDNTHSHVCCANSVCGGHELHTKTLEWIKSREAKANEKAITEWLVAERTHSVKCQQWLEEEAKYHEKLADWLAAEQAFKATLRVKAPKVVHAERQVNRPVTAAAKQLAKHVQ